MIPPHLAEKWDNTGLMVGNPDDEVTGVMIALDYHEDLLAEAEARGCNFLFTHHPLIFKPIPRVDASDYVGGVIFSLVSKGIHLYCAHTNLDIVMGGVNDVLAAKLGLTNVSVLDVTGEFDGVPVGLGRAGDLSEPMRAVEFLGCIKKVLDVDSLAFSGDSEAMVSRVAVCGGSGGSLVDLARSRGCQMLVTGDVGYHTAQRALRVGLALVDGTHYHTESLCFSRMAEIVGQALDGDEAGIHILERQLNTFTRM
jgi:dinuclear metal center YbgI/SA1388 family protein